MADKTIRLISKAGLSAVRWSQVKSGAIYETGYSRDDIHRDEWAKDYSKKTTKHLALVKKAELLARGWAVG